MRNRGFGWTLLFRPKFTRDPTYISGCRGIRRDLRDVWLDDSIVLTRLVRLILALIQFINPYNWWCNLFEWTARKLLKKHHRQIGDKPYKANYFASEVWIIGKLVVPLVLVTSYTRSPFWYYLCLFFVGETFIYTMRGIFAAPKTPPISSIRSALHLLMAFFSTTFSFAFTYLYTGGVVDAQASPLSSPQEAIYFSLVTASTTGYGDFHATSSAQILVILQIAASVFFLVSFFPVFFSRITTALPRTWTGRRRR